MNQDIRLMLARYAEAVKWHESDDDKQEREIIAFVAGIQAEIERQETTIKGQDERIIQQLTEIERLRTIIRTNLTTHQIK